MQGVEFFQSQEQFAAERLVDGFNSLTMGGPFFRIFWEGESRDQRFPTKVSAIIQNLGQPGPEVTNPIDSSTQLKALEESDIHPIRTI